MNINKICCIGAGYVGGPTMAVIAQKNPDIQVTLVDLNKEKIDLWNSDDYSELPVYEPGLSDVIKEVRGRNLFFSNDIDKNIDDAEMIFISVNTPTKTEGEGKGYAADLKYVESCAKQIAKVSKSNKIIVEKSTVPVRTSEKIKEILKLNNNNLEFQILSNPEFLAEGTAMRDLQIPDRVIIGGDNSVEGKLAVNLLVNIYLAWVPRENIITTNLWSSELSKLTANAFLAQRISSINSLSELCEHTGANIDEVAKAIGMDSRIGPSFLKTSVGFGGSCFQKDILNLVYIARSLELNIIADYWEQILIVNKHQRDRFSEKIISTIEKESLINNILILGWSFKKNTNDTRESAAIYVANNLLAKKIEMSVFDPQVNNMQIQNDLKSLNSDYIENSVNLVKDIYSEISKSNIIVIITEWDEFVSYDWEYIFQKMKKPAYIFDGRNILDREIMQEIGFLYFGIGK